MQRQEDKWETEGRWDTLQQGHHPAASVPPSPHCLCFCCLLPWWRWRITAGGRINRRRMARHLLPALHQLLLKHDELASSSEHVELPRMLVFHSVTFVFVGFLLWTSSRLLFLGFWLFWCSDSVLFLRLEFFLYIFSLSQHTFSYFNHSCIITFSSFRNLQLRLLVFLTSTVLKMFPLIHSFD